MINKIKKFFKKLPFSEKMLLLFMTIIYTQIIYNLLSNEIINDNTSPIDTIVRTAASSIFGYFLGSNIDTNDEDEEIQKKEPKVITYKNSNTNTVIISILGIVSLLIMLYLRNFTTLTYSSIASISQLKDFVSASVGYLVSKSSKTNMQ